MTLVERAIIAYKTTEPTWLTELKAEILAVLGVEGTEIALSEDYREGMVVQVGEVLLSLYGLPGEGLRATHLPLDIEQDGRCLGRVRSLWELGRAMTDGVQLPN